LDRTTAGGVVLEIEHLGFWAESRMMHPGDGAQGIDDERLVDLTSEQSEQGKHDGSIFHPTGSFRRGSVERLVMVMTGIIGIDLSARRREVNVNAWPSPTAGFSVRMTEMSMVFPH
jgi:hypothetical protein